MQLLSSSHSRIDGVSGRMINYRPVYEHKGSTLSADSGFLYRDDLGREFFDAYGNIIITQSNGTTIYARRLNYEADNQFATLTDNVRMVDGNSVLTTNFLTYNLRSGIGTYTGGGRIVNKADTITSKNAWYFRETQDAYFRHEVIVRTPDVMIFTDTMRYNSGSKNTYFYGPTNIQGKKGENLFTEEGYYNTESELAEFFKNNLYTEKSRMLKADTLFYDGKSGNGRGIGKVVFVDTTDQFFAEGNKGLYHKANESILLTDYPLVTMVVKDDNKVPDSVYMTADTLFSQMILLKDYKPMDFQLNRDGGEIEEEEVDYGDSDSGAGLPVNSLGGSTDSLKTDSLAIAIDSLGVANKLPDGEAKLGLDSLKVPDSLQQGLIPKPIADTTKTVPVKMSLAKTAATKAPAQTDALATKISSELKADSVLRQQTSFPTGREVDSLMRQAKVAVEKSKAVDSLAQDSLVSDTARTRIIKAYRNVRIFKSDLQAVADSVYYGYPDSMMRMFGKPMVWAQGSQMSGDSLYLQLKNEKIDNLLLLGNGFLANTKQDSSKYNQIKGKKITGFFTNGTLERIFIDGNAESIAFRENKEKTGFTEMHHNRSSRIKILMADEEVTDFVPIRSTEGTIFPIQLLPQERELLEGFIWKPSDRPKSKEDMLKRKRVADTTVIPNEPEEPTDPDTGVTVDPADQDPDQTTTSNNAVNTAVQKN
jgi:lipopolysaccharide export system protein LptA